MKYHLAASLSLLALASAQSKCAPLTADVPSCALPCLSSAAEAAKCAPDDYACQCAPATNSAVAAAGQKCVLDACGDEAVSVAAPLNSLCDCATGAAEQTPGPDVKASGGDAEEEAAGSAGDVDEAVEGLGEGGDQDEEAMPTPEDGMGGYAPAATEAPSASGSGAWAGNGSATDIYPPIETGAASKGAVVEAAAGLVGLLAVVAVL